MTTQSLQASLYTRLTDAQALPVYSDVPQPTEPEDESLFPYVFIGEFVALAFDTKTSIGEEVLADIHVIHRGMSTGALRGIADGIKSILHRYNLPMAGTSYVNLVFDGSTGYTEADGKTKHVVQTYRVKYFEE